MDNPSSNETETIAINYCEIPETIFVETRFITLAAARQKQNENLSYLINKNGQWELSSSKEQFVALKNFRPTFKPKTITLSIQPRPPTTATANKSVVPAPTPPLQSLRPVSLTKYSNNLLNTNATLNTASLPRVTAVPISTSNSFPETVSTANVMSTPKPLQFSKSTPKPTMIDHMQQTEISAFSMKSVGIQCKLNEDNDDLAWPIIQEDLSVQNELSGSTDIEKETFLNFAKDNSTQYKNSFRECLICGEVSKSTKSFYAHMATHQGPKVLCFKCGFSLDNEELLRKHKCLKLRTENKIRLNCPHYGCNIVAISKLELYDHINEHEKHCLYKCTGCKKAFHTRQEFLRHILIRAKCYTQARRKRYCIYNLERQRDRLCRQRVFTLHSFKKRTILGRERLSQRPFKREKCKICLKSFVNTGVFKRHRFKCLKEFRRRLTRKRYATKSA